MILMLLNCHPELYPGLGRLVVAGYRGAEAVLRGVVDAEGLRGRGRHLLPGDRRVSAAGRRHQGVEVWVRVQCFS